MKADLVNEPWQRRAGQGRRGDTRDSLPQSPLRESFRRYQLLLVLPAPVKSAEKRISPGLSG